MKKWTSLFLALAMTISLLACGSAGNPDTASKPPVSSSIPTAAETPAPTATEIPAEEPAESEAATPEDSSSVLIAYFSWSGNTEAMAGMIQEQTGGDLFAIEPETPYTGDYNALLEQAQQEQADNARPALAAQVENWEQYDTVFVGYPNWWSDAPMIVLSFLESYDCTGKTVIPFCTSGGGGFGHSVDSVTTSAAGATVLEGLHVSGSRVESAQSDITAWLDELGV